MLRVGGSFKMVLASVWTLLTLLGHAVGLAQDTSRKVDLFGDVNFEQGFVVTKAGKTIGELFSLKENEDGASGTPKWELATHASKFNIAEGEISCGANVKRASTPGQLVEVKTDDTGTATLRLGVRTENEYLHPRRADEWWIHLLLCRNFSESERPAFVDLYSLVFSCDARVADFAKTDSSNPYDPGLHTTQASVYFVFANLNKESKDFGDYIWFGISFFDEREEVQSDYIAVDGDPKTIGTGKLIYRLGGQKTIDNMMGGVNPYSKEWTHIEADLVSYLEDALDAAKERGFLVDSKLEDFVVTHFNFGWETPGTYRSDLLLKNLNLNAVFKK